MQASATTAGSPRAAIGCWSDARLGSAAASRPDCSPRELAMSFFPEKAPDNPDACRTQGHGRCGAFANDQSGYFREQATRPQTIGYPLADSAAGQALWIYEKFQAWTDNHGNPEDALNVDAMLDTSASIGSPTVPHRLLASTGRIPAPARQAFPKGGSNCLWRRRSSRTRFSARLEHGPRRYANLFYWNELDTRRAFRRIRATGSLQPKSCERPSGHGAPSELAGGDACRHVLPHLWSNAPMSNRDSKP